MVFRVNLAHRTAYIFYICPDRGTYCLERENIHIEYVMSCQTDAGLPNGVGILSSRESITLAVIANGINFTLYVNHNIDPIHAVDDSEQALKQGQIGVDTEALKDNGIYYPSQIEFTNAEVWTLS